MSKRDEVDDAIFMLLDGEINDDLDGLYWRTIRRECVDRIMGAFPEAEIIPTEESEKIRDEVLDVSDNALGLEELTRNTGSHD